MPGVESWPRPHPKNVAISAKSARDPGCPCCAGISYRNFLDLIDRDLARSAIVGLKNGPGTLAWIFCHRRKAFCVAYNRDRLLGSALRRRYRPMLRALAICGALGCGPAAAAEPGPEASAPVPASGSFIDSLDFRELPFIPIPEIGTDPDRGTVLGILPIFLTTDQQKEIRQIIAPDIIRDPNFGWGARGRIFSYPSDDTQWFVVAGVKQRVEREFDAVYNTGLTRRED
jgi:hypothetical protein